MTRACLADLGELSTDTAAFLRSAVKICHG